MFRAYDAERERLVAVKLFKIDLPPERVHQLAAELDRIVHAQLDHPALAAPLAAGIVGVSAYLAQEYVAADSLDSIVREYGAAPPADALRVAAQLAGALDFAGVVKIAHGAMHPRDVLLSSDETRLTGIGITGALEKVGVAAPVRRPYTAPERIAGAAWDRRADVFSLAAVMHELLWARRAAGTGARAADALGDIDGGDRDTLRAVFARALADDPAERFETALEFVEALSSAFPNVTLAPPERRDRAANVPSRKMHADEPMLPLEINEAPTIVRAAEAPPASDVDPIAMFAAEEERYRDAEVAPAIVDEAPAIPDPPLGVGAPASGRAEAALRLDAANDVSAIHGRADAASSFTHTDHSDVAAVPMRGAYEPEPASAGDRTRSGVWPVVVALGVGVGVGFAGGYGVGTHGRQDAPPPSATASAATDTARPTTGASPETAQPSRSPSARSTTGAAPASAGREFTENAVPPAAKRTPATPPAPSARTAPPTTAATGEAGRVLVRSTPAGAAVTVDGKDYGRTPVAVRDLARGVHRVRLTYDGYTSVERRVVISAAHPAQSLTIPLAKAPPTAAAAADPARAAAAGYAGSLVVDSRPSGANVYVDGKLAGTTPLTVADMRAGEHAIRIERDGYRRWTSSVRIVSGEQNKVTASLER